MLLPETQQLAVAGRAIEQLADLLTQRSCLFIGDWEEAYSTDDEILPALEPEFSNIISLFYVMISLPQFSTICFPIS